MKQVERDFKKYVDLGGQGNWAGFQQGFVPTTTGGQPFSGLAYTSNAQHVPANYTSGAQALQLLGLQKG